MPKDLTLREFRVIREDYARDPEGTVVRFREALDSGQINPRNISLREMFEGLVEDGSEVIREFDPRWGSKRGISLVEAGQAVDTSAFANINGQIVYSTVLKPYEFETEILNDLMQTIPTRFNGEKIPGVGEIGDETEAIDEGQPYPNLGVNEEWVTTPMTRKQGGIVPVTKEAIFFDRTNVLLDRCDKMGKWLGINKLKQGLSTVLALTYNGINYNTYNRNGVNTNTYLTSGAYVNMQNATPLVDYTSVNQAEQLLNQILDPNTNQPVVIQPDTIIVPEFNKYTARRIANATQYRTIYPGFATQGASASISVGTPGNVELVSDGKVLDRDYKVVTSRWIRYLVNNGTGLGNIDKDKSWWIGAPKEAFAWMENWPITVVQAPTNSEAEFTQDIVMRYKASHRGWSAILNPRYMVQMNPT